jgi:hypothetical protein
MRTKRGKYFIPGFVTLSAKSSSERPGFSINAYTGAIVDTQQNMKLVFDLDGMKSKPSLPVLREHERDRPVGYGSGQASGGAFVVNGFFATSKDGIECLALAEEGFPWQASVGIKPISIRQLSPGESTIVNSRTVTGPAEIWLKSEVKEVSFVSLGADSSTSISVFSDQGGELFDVDVEEPCRNSISVKNRLREIAPDEADSLYRQFVMDGVLTERKRCLDILNINCPTGSKIEGIRNGLSLSDAYLAIWSQKGTQHGN